MAKKISLQRIKREIDAGRIPHDVAHHRDGYGAIAAYLEMIDDGLSPNMAEMLACKKAPGAKAGPFGAIKPGVGPTIEGDRIIKSLGRD